MPSRTRSSPRYLKRHSGSISSCSYPVLACHLLPPDLVRRSPRSPCDCGGCHFQSPAVGKDYSLTGCKHAIHGSIAELRSLLRHKSQRHGGNRAGDRLRQCRRETEQGPGEFCSGRPQHQRDDVRRGEDFPREERQKRRLQLRIGGQDWRHRKTIGGSQKPADRNQRADARHPADHQPRRENRRTCAPQPDTEISQPKEIRRTAERCQKERRLGGQERDGHPADGNPFHR